MPDTARSTIHWLRGCMILIKIASILFLLAGLLYLAIAGANFAVMGAIFFADEQTGTSMIVVYALALFALFFAAGLLGIWATGERVRLHTIIFIVVSALAAVAVFAGIGTGNFHAPESAFGNGIINGVNLFFGVLAAVTAGLGISAIVSENKLAQMGAGEEAEGADEAADAEPAADADEAVEETVAEEAPVEDEAPADETTLLNSALDNDEFEGKQEEVAEDVEVADEAADEAVADVDELVDEQPEEAPIEAPAEAPVEAPAAEPIPADSTAMFIAASMQGGLGAGTAPAAEAAPVASDAEAAPGAVPVPRVKRTAMHLPSAQRAAAERPQQPVDDSPIDETEWVDFGSHADDDDEPSGFFGRHMRR